MPKNNTSFVNNPEVKVSKNAKLMLLQRFAPDISPNVSMGQRLIFAEELIRKMWETATYLTDGEKGVVFVNKPYAVSIFVKDRVITTVNNSTAFKGVS